MDFYRRNLGGENVSFVFTFCVLPRSLLLESFFLLPGAFLFSLSVMAVNTGRLAAQIGA